MSRTPRVNLDKTVQNRSNKELMQREENTPVYASQKFIPPKTLNAAEKKVWKWLGEIFRATVNCRVSDADVHLMALYCQAKVAYEEARERYDANPEYWVKVENGTDQYGQPKYLVKVNSDYAIMKDKSAAMIKLFDQLGLSPLARARAGLSAANAQKDADIFEGLMARTDE